MAQHIIPKFDETAFNCPRCGAYANQSWYLGSAYDKERAETYGQTLPKGTIDEFAFSNCTHCNEISVWLRGKKTLIYPKITTRAFDLTEVPNHLADDYEEACLVLADSPKASSALSRRCLQSILREQGFEDKSLNKEIQKAIDSGKLPSHIADSLDAVRSIGNLAAHPTKDTSTGEILPVEPGEAEWNIEILEFLFDFFYIQPAKTRKRKEALIEKLKAAGK
ncbi:MAG: DUF4145 domain-containing protein [Sediminibacterium sp.]|nr:DUF4145 domain-containing protein [Sediminibacterium sp.]